MGQSAWRRSPRNCPARPYPSPCRSGHHQWTKLPNEKPHGGRYPFTFTNRGGSILIGKVGQFFIGIDKWVNESETRYIYEGDTNTQVVTYQWDGTQWVESSRTVYEWN